jgi:hypothetical protein
LVQKSQFCKLEIARDNILIQKEKSASLAFDFGIADNASRPPKWLKRCGVCKLSVYMVYGI